MDGLVLNICLTLEECEDSQPCDGPVARYLEYDEDCYQSYGRLKLQGYA